MADELEEATQLLETAGLLHETVDASYASCLQALIAVCITRLLAELLPPGPSEGGS